MPMVKCHGFPIKLGNQRSFSCIFTFFMETGGPSINTGFVVMSRLFLLVPAFVLLSFSAVQAAPATASAPAPAPATNSDTFIQPDLISFGLAYDDFDKNEARRQSGDIRAEYRWGMSLLPMISSYFTKWDPYVQFHPFAGGEVGTLGQIYGLGGFAMDAYIGRHVIFTWSEGAGLYYGGDSVRLGSVLEFRSMGELGWRFDNEMRVTAELSHISNAKITKWNPGNEYAGVYLHVPVGMIF